MLLTVWIPLGSGARCAMLAYSSILPYTENPISLWMFSAVYCADNRIRRLQKEPDARSARSCVDSTLAHLSRTYRGLGD